MRFFKILLVVFLVLLSALAAGLYLMAQPLTDRLTASMIRAVHSKLAASGIESRIEIQKNHYDFPAGLTYTGITAAGRIPRQDRLGQGWDTQLNVETARISLKSISAQIFEVHLSNLMLRLQPNSQQGRDGLGYDPIDLYIRDLELPLQVRVFGADHGLQDVQKVVRDLQEFARSGRSFLPFRFTGKLFFKIEDNPVEVAVHAQTEDKKTRLVLSRDDLMRLGGLTEDGLTPSEAELLAAHPVEVPRLLAIQRYVSRVSKEAGLKDPRVPQDAYRHVLWSYLLTKAYGPGFAKQVTDAHEIGINKKVNTTADHAMDYKNNRVGMAYADLGVSEDEVLWKILSDPEVILSASDPRVR